MSTSSGQSPRFHRSGLVAALFLLVIIFPLVSRGSENDDFDLYTLGVGDVIRVEVYGSPDLGVKFPVRPDGRISLPLIGEVVAAGETPAALMKLLTEGYEKFVTAPNVSVVVEEINSLRVFITGEVREPGAYDILAPTKLMQALAMAGGLTEYAKKDRVVVLRDLGKAGDQRLELSVAGIASGKEPEDNILLVAGDTVIVP